MPRNIVISLRVIAVIVSLVSIAIFAPLRAVYVYLMPLSDDIQTEVDRATAAGLDGVIVWIDDGHQQSPSSYTAGWHNYAAHQPARADALFKIASISKLYIAAAVTRLAVGGQLDLDKTIHEYLPELTKDIDNAGRITLKMLVQHRSGIANYSAQPDFPWFNPYEESQDTQQSLALIYNKPANFAPGTDYEYSNTNYLLLGRVIDKTLGYSYTDYITREFIIPLGLTHTYPSIRHVQTEHLMSGFLQNHDQDLKNLAFISPPGAMVANASDVANFVRALNDGSLLTPQEQALYSTLYEYGHDGWLPGYLSFAHYFADIDTVIVLFASTSGDEPWLIADFTYQRVLSLVRQRHQQ